MGIRIGAALAAAGLLAGCGAVERAAGPPPTPDAILRDFGYDIRVPPSALHGPGSLVFRRNAPGIGPGKVALGDICSPATMTFPDTLSRSSAETIGFGRDADFAFDARTLELLGLSASAGAIETPRPALHQHRGARIRARGSGGDPRRARAEMRAAARPSGRARQRLAGGGRLQGRSRLFHRLPRGGLGRGALFGLA